MSKAFLTDTTRCIGCRGCQVACKGWNELPAEGAEGSGSYENPKTLSANTWRKVRFVESGDSAVRWSFLSDSCKHCSDASCLSACPTGAITRSTAGAVVVNDERCNGCRYCVTVCPFKVMAFDEARGRVAKCTMCADRQEAGLAPSCAGSCPTGGLLFGERDELLKTARARLKELLEVRMVKANLYGESELGGLGNLMILTESPVAYGLPLHPRAGSEAVIPSSILSVFGSAITVVAAVVAFRDRAKSKEG